MGNNRKMRRSKGILWEYNGDGVFYYERIKGFWKKYWRKWAKRKEKFKNLVC